MQLGESSTMEGRQFLYCVMDNILTQRVKIPTQYDSTLDPVLTSEPD
jgi:hypothetical protein